MTQPKVFILRTAGTNCDYETKSAFEKVGAQVDLIHVNTWLENKSLLHDYHIFVLPGGFTYGDDIAAGIILANELKQHLLDELLRFIQDRKLILGICNGFQVLVRIGLLPGSNSATNPSQTVTLTNNNSGKFEDRWVYLKPSSRLCEFTKGWDRELIYLPVAHAEGKFIPKDTKVLRSFINNDQVVFRYTDSKGKPTRRYPFNPNSSEDNIAGICDSTGRILGMMPHPERYADRTNHPRWTRETLPEPPDGMLIFQNAVDYVRKNLL